MAAQPGYQQNVTHSSGFVGGQNAAPTRYAHMQHPHQQDPQVCCCGQFKEKLRQ